MLCMLIVVIISIRVSMMVNVILSWLLMCSCFRVFMVFFVVVLGVV